MSDFSRKKASVPQCCAIIKYSRWVLEYSLR